MTGSEYTRRAPGSGPRSTAQGDFLRLMPKAAGENAAGLSIRRSSGTPSPSVSSPWPGTSSVGRVNSPLHSIPADLTPKSSSASTSKSTVSSGSITFWRSIPWR
jgi:hypothetical protein